MNNFTLFLATLLTFSIYSCTQEEDQMALYDFSGIYSGTALCSDSENDTYAEETTLVIEKTGELSYLLIFEDDLAFVAVQEDDILTIEQQTVNQDQEFDVVSLEGSISRSTNGIIMETLHTVDDEGQATCTTSLIRQ